MPPRFPATPAIATQAAVRRLPRWVLLVLCITYVLPGFVGRGPWKNADIAAFGVMSDLARGVADWKHPTFMGLSPDTPAVLPYWIGGWTMQTWPQQAEWVVRMPFIAAVLATFFFTWHATFRFALLRSAQPVAFAFGGEAAPVDYARSLADGALLALLACLGLAQLSHETTPSVFQLLGTAALLRAMASFVTSGKPMPLRAGGLWISGLLILGWSGAPWLAVWLAALPAPTIWMGKPGKQSHFPDRLRLWVWGIGLVTTGVSALLWETMFRADTWSEALNTVPDLVGQAKLLFWFAWPVWPLAMWTLWQWRKHLRSHHLLGPVGMVATVVCVSAWSSGSDDRLLLLALPALSLLAAFALPTLKRSVTALLDWFSVLFFSVCAITVWVIWLAMLTGFPAKPAANVARLAPGFSMEFSAAAFAIAVVGTVGWLWVVRWRLGRHPSALWKSLVLPATGGTLCWLLLMTLWMPLLDFARSYAPLSQRIANWVPQGMCTEVFGLTQAQMVGLTHHGNLVLKLAPSPARCDYLVVSPQAEQSMFDELGEANWTFKARFNRLTDNKESLLLYQRAAAPAYAPESTNSTRY